MADVTLWKNMKRGIICRNKEKRKLNLTLKLKR